MNHILFVCMGNICRSPTAKGVFDRRLKEAGLQIVTESAGTHDYHVGSTPDERSIAMARRWGVDISGDRARRIGAADYQRFDRIFVMDRSNLEIVQQLRPDSCRAELSLVMSLAPGYGLDEVPDPYYGGEAGFRRVLDMLDAAAAGLIAQLEERDRR